MKKVKYKYNYENRMFLNITVVKLKTFKLCKLDILVIKPEIFHFKTIREKICAIQCKPFYYYYYNSPNYYYYKYMYNYKRLQYCKW